MKNAAHLDAEQLARYQDRTLEPAQLLAADRHLAECDECRGVLFNRAGAQAQLSGLRARLSEHLAYDQISACAEGHMQRAHEEHLGECAACRAEVEDLMRFRGELTPRSRPSWLVPAWSAAAAALVLATGLMWWNGRKAPPTAPVAVAQRQAPKSTEPELAPAEREAVQLALSSRKLDRAPVLDRLISKRGVLLGDTGELKTFDLSGPMGTAIINDRPVFRWQVARGAKQYVVSVFDDSFQKVTESPALSATEWQPAKPLPRGRIYVWQVSATIGGEVVRAPIPPAPEARFQIAGEDVAAAIDKARAEHPGNHLLLAVLLAKNGALDESALELDALAVTDPATAQGLRESLAEIRRK
jgi:anti-sigma factor ChrR (cupin superfamily)